jgi:hypothetical protein
VGAALSASAGWYGMSVATHGNVRTTVACAESDLNAGLTVAFTTGACMGFTVVSLGLAGVSITFLVMGAGYSDANALQVLAGFGFGASAIALFARVAGGIYTKAADVGADLVGKVEAGIDEDDPHNPAVIADNVRGLRVCLGFCLGRGVLTVFFFFLFKKEMPSAGHSHGRALLSAFSPKRSQKKRWATTSATWPAWARTSLSRTWAPSSPPPRWPPTTASARCPSSCRRPACCAAWWATSP